MKKHLLPALLFFIMSFTAFAQETLITGIITNEKEEALPGATIYIKQKSFGTGADIDGNFVLKNVQPGDTLVFSYVGYAKQQVVFREEKDYKIRLKGGGLDLPEVIVTFNKYITSGELIYCPQLLVEQNLRKMRDLRVMQEHDLPEFPFFIFPNPTNGAFTVTHEAPLNTLSITNANGQILKTFTDLNENQASLDISAYPSGTYFVIRRDSQGNSSTVKIILTTNFQR